MHVVILKEILRFPFRFFSVYFCWPYETEQASTFMVKTCI